MMPWFVWKGKNSLGDFGLWVSKFPQRVKAEERHEEIKIPGRAGSLTVLEGDDIYSSYVSEMVVVARNTLAMDKIIDWLRGSSELVLSIETDKSRVARIVGKIAFERIGNCLQQATIPFLFQPFRKSRYPGKDRFTYFGNITENQVPPVYIYNPGQAASYPIITITTSSSKDVTIKIAGQEMVFNAVNGTIVVDCDAKVILTGASVPTLWTGIYTGEFIKIPVGQNWLQKITNASTTVIDPNWRWL